MALQFTTLVPAYKPKYLVELLTAIRHQIVKPARIIISDDSPHQSFVVALTNEPLKSLIADLKIEVVAGPRLGAYSNFRYLMHLYDKQTALFHILCDDDIPYPSFYEQHLHAHSILSSRAVVSRRWTALESGQPISDLKPPSEVHAHPNRMFSLDAGLLFQKTVALSMNWLGEFSNTTFSAEMVDELDDPSLDGICFTGLEDLGAFLKASLKSPIVYINEHLGYFRTSADQHSANPMGQPMKWAFLAYLALAIGARRLDKLSEIEYQLVLDRVCPLIQYHFGMEEDMKALCLNMTPLLRGDLNAVKNFLVLWHNYSGSALRPSLANIVSHAKQ